VGGLVFGCGRPKRRKLKMAAKSRLGGGGRMGLTCYGGGVVSGQKHALGGGSEQEFWCRIFSAPERLEEGHEGNDDTGGGGGVEGPRKVLEGIEGDREVGKIWKKQLVYEPEKKREGKLGFQIISRLGGGQELRGKGGKIFGSGKEEGEKKRVKVVNNPGGGWKWEEARICLSGERTSCTKEKKRTLEKSITI